MTEAWGLDEAAAATETTRDFKSFERRSGALPEQADGDTMDYRYLLHRDGSVLSAGASTLPCSRVLGGGLKVLRKERELNSWK